jgi:hypothetical protein
MRLEAQQGRTRTRLSRGTFAIGLPMLEAGDNARFCVTLPWASCGMAVQAGSDDPTAPPQASGVQQRESGPEGVGAKDESNGSWEDQAEGKGMRRKAICGEEGPIYGHGVTCDLSGAKLTRTRLICLTCPQANFSKGNFERRGADRDLLGRCSEHRFMEVPGPSWDDLAPGTVNTRGESVEEWLKRLMNEYPELS